MKSTLIFFMTAVLLTAQGWLSIADAKEGLRLYPEDVAAYNSLTAIPPHFDVPVVHEKFTLTPELIRPRSHGPSWVRFADIDFNKGFKYLRTRYSVDSHMGRTFVEIRLGQPNHEGLLIGDFRVENTGGYEHFIERVIPLNAPDGRHNLYIVFEHGGDYAYFELLKEKPEAIEMAPSASDYPEFVRPDLSLQDKPQHFDVPMPISVELIDQALLQLSSGGRAGFHRGRLTENRDSRQAVAILATSVAGGNDDIFVIEKLLEVMRGQRNSILNGLGRVKYLMDSALGYSIAQLWQCSHFMEHLSLEEQQGLRLFMKGMLFENAFMMADFTPDGRVRGAQRFQLNGLEAWTGGNPNYYERHSTCFVYAASVVGFDETPGLLASYDHHEFLAELQASPFPGISKTLHDHFNHSFIRLIGRTRYDARSPERKAEMLEAYLQSIQRLDAEGKPFYKGLTLDQILESPGRLQYANFKDRTFGKRAMQGDFIGRWGMYHEFSTADGGDEALGASLYLRDDLDYALYSPRQPVYYNLFLRSNSHWMELDPEQREWIADRLSIAMSDLQAKAGGYWSTNFRGSSFKKISDRRTYIFAEQILANMGHIRPRLFAENFERDPISITWNKTGNWTRTTVDTWTGRPQHRLSDIAADTVMESPADESAFLSSEAVISDFNLYVQAMPLDATLHADARIGLVGRFQDPGNTYAMVYHPASEALQILRIKNGEETLLAETNYPLDSGQMVYLRGEFSGDTLNFYVNSQKLVSAQCDAFATGHIGLHTQSFRSQFDNLLVTTAHFGDLGHQQKEPFLDRLLNKQR